MATNKKLRTPIIKPRTQGGTLYTFGSALEDIGLNINKSNNKVDISHYVLLDIPSFGKNAGNLRIPINGEYSENVGDYQFAEYFQDAVLNMETVLRNDLYYNFSSPKTVSERVFWKYLFKDKSASDFTYDNGYFYENPNNTYAKAFGQIITGSQRVDSYGIYNETFVQIPSSYGQMRVLFKKVNDENYSYGTVYSSSNNGIIEGVDSSEIDGGTLIATGISAEGIFDLPDYKYTSDSSTDLFEVEFDIEKLREYYNNEYLTIDDIGFGNVSSAVDFSDRFNFNAILLYYSIYDSVGTTLATNAFGLYILDNSIESSIEESVYYFPTLLKIQTNGASSGTSFSFRINIKPTSAYSGDITVSDNSTTAFANSEDFNDIIKNLTKATEILKSNARSLQTMSNDNSDIKKLAMEAIDKINDLEETVNGLSLKNNFNTLVTDTIKIENIGGTDFSLKPIAYSVLKNTSVSYDDTGNYKITINKNNLTGDSLKFAESMISNIDGKEYVDMMKVLVLLLSYIPTSDILASKNNTSTR